MYAAIYVGLSRISDYKHHWSDVLMGALLGSFLAALVVRIDCLLYIISIAIISSCFALNSRSSVWEIARSALRSKIIACVNQGQ